MKKKLSVFMVLALMMTYILTACGSSNNQSRQSSAPAASNTPAASKAPSSLPPSPESKFPQKAIEMIVPYEAGGTTDVIARLVAEAAGKFLPKNQPIVIVNKPGGGATIGMTEVANAAPDGYKIAFTPVSAMTITPHFGETTYKLDSFQPILNITNVPQVFIVKKDAPWKTTQEFLEYAAKNRVVVGSAAAGGIQNLVVEQLKSLTKAKLEIVPYSGTAPVLTAILGGEVIGGVGGAPNATSNEKLKALFSFGSNRSAVLPDVTTLKEAGYDVKGDLLSGIVAPKGLPQDVLKILHDAFKKATDEPALEKKLLELGYEKAYYGVDEFKKVLAAQSESYQTALKQAGLIK